MKKIIHLVQAPSTSSKWSSFQAFIVHYAAFEMPKACYQSTDSVQEG